MNQYKEKNGNFFTETLHGVRKWPLERKRVFSISVAIFLTILIIILNSVINLVWKDEPKDIIYTKNNPVDTVQESLSKFFNEAKPILDQAFSSSSQYKIIDQINSTSSSFSTTSNVVR